jgi:tRNA nucleotidyltransferase (CCA-adding enzyme)
LLSPSFRPFTLSPTSEKIKVRPVSAMEIHVNNPAVVDDLMAAFRAGDCLAHRLGSHAFVVIHRHALDDQEARVEVEFFLRAWQQRRGGVEANVVE